MFETPEGSQTRESDNVNGKWITLGPRMCTCRQDTRNSRQEHEIEHRYSRTNAEVAMTLKTNQEEMMKGPPRLRRVILPLAVKPDKRHSTLNPIHLDYPPSRRGLSVKPADALRTFGIGDKCGSCRTDVW